MRKTRLIPAFALLLALVIFFFLGVCVFADVRILPEQDWGSEFGWLFIFWLFPAALLVCGIVIGILLNPRECGLYFAVFATAFLLVLLIISTINGNWAYSISSNLAFLLLGLFAFTLIHFFGAMLALGILALKDLGRPGK